MVLNLRDGAIVLFLVILDQATKAWARAVEPNNILFQLTYNTGAGFGILQGKNIILLVISIIVLILLAKPLSETSGREKFAYLALGAGIIGNSIDRVSIGAVTDFISVGTFPIFNVADSLITLSILYLVARGLKESFSSWNFKRKGKKTN